MAQFVEYPYSRGNGGLTVVDVDPAAARKRGREVNAAVIEILKRNPTAPPDCSLTALKRHRNWAIASSAFACLLTVSAGKLPRKMPTGRNFTKKPSKLAWRQT
jgi:hypothetical protein